MNLLNHYSLALVEYLKLSAELQRVKGAEEEAQAKVELKLTPIAPVGDSFAQFGHILQANLNVQGYGQSSANNLLFVVEVRLNACYRPMQAHDRASREFDRFQRHHGSFTRQIFPLLHAKANELLTQLGVNYLRLPFDLIESESVPTEKETHEDGEAVGASRQIKTVVH